MLLHYDNFVATSRNHKRPISNLQRLSLLGLEPSGSRIKVKGIAATRLLWISNLLC
jgi:hypothetical protein